MGIKTLLPFLKDVAEETHLHSFEGLVAEVDASCWLPFSSPEPLGFTHHFRFADHVTKRNEGSGNENGWLFEFSTMWRRPKVSLWLTWVCVSIGFTRIIDYFFFYIGCRTFAYHI